ncbi:S1C family serine protease [Pseudoroseicyclus sp. CXY001]|uniref:S1C family serine protease n=1 Tax=Pseudoroseicyclus sp. CXY001 TaxID=3242492 RepID=UPI003570BBF0
MARRHRSLGGALIGPGMLLACGLGIFIGWGWAQAQAPEPVPPAPIVLSGEEADLIALFEASRDSVVAITTSERRMNPFTRASVDRPLASGSGFIWDAEGHVVTNAHVISGASAVSVTLADGRSFEAELVGSDPSHDLAVLKIAGGDLPAPLPIGESADLRVGQGVLAIGNPFGLDWTLTTGIVSALDRDLAESTGVTITGLIQTDAAINPGNSGGPLIDMRGELIGVNTAILSPSGSSSGIGLAIPAHVLARVVPQLIEEGRYLPPSLGLTFDARVNAAVNRQGLDGALVLAVEPGSAAAAEGIQPAQMSRDGRIAPGDVVVGVDGTPVQRLEDLMAAIDRKAVGESVEITLSRGSRERTVTLELLPGA